MIYRFLFDHFSEKRTYVLGMMSLFVFLGISKIHNKIK